MSKEVKTTSAKRKPRFCDTTDKFARQRGYAPIQRFYPSKTQAKTMSVQKYVETFCEANHYAI